MVFEIFDLKVADKQNSTLTDNKGPLKLSAREPIQVAMQSAVIAFTLTQRPSKPRKLTSSNRPGWA